MLEVGQSAPQFSLLDEEGNRVNLNDFLGRKVVIYFYPKDNTSGCTKQACSIRNDYGEFEKRKVTVLGISKDSVTSHYKFKSNNNLPFTLLSDEDLVVIKQYGAYGNKVLYGRSYLGVLRIAYIIDEKGVIIKTFKKMNVITSAEQLLKALD